MVARTGSAVIVGVRARLVSVEADVSSGLPAMTVVGLADTAVNEARDRVRAAVQHSRAEWPRTRITVALLPSSLPKRGSGLDAAIAIAVLAAARQVPPDTAARVCVLGELGLDGRLHAVPGVIAAALAARDLGGVRLLVPEANLGEALLVPGLDAGGVRDLDHLISILRGDAHASECPVESPNDHEPQVPDLIDVRGQPEAREALEVAAAGGHHLSLVGEPGAGKSMLASRLPGLLPPLDDEAALEVTAIRSIAGQLSGAGLLRRPPFVAPHHTASSVSIIGGGQAGRVTVGAVTLAHRGVLFLDEAPEFARPVLEAMRQPLEEGEVRVARADLSVTLPACCQLVIAANPCPCGRGMGDGADCSCSSVQRRRYAARISGPLADRIDLRLQIHRPAAAALDAEGECTAAVAARVREARERTRERWRSTPWRVNADVPGPALRRDWPPEAPGVALLARAVTRGALTLRGADRVLRVGWTLADLAGRPRPTVDDIARAIALRGPEAA